MCSLEYLTVFNLKLLLRYRDIFIMTFKSLISNSGTAQSSFLNPFYDSGYKDLKRGDYSHGWKSSHKGNSALNAITLLAFLFFLNILQSCLRDNLAANQGPIVVVITTETTTNSSTTTTRTKRSYNTTKNEATRKYEDDILLKDASQMVKAIEDEVKPEQ